MDKSKIVFFSALPPFRGGISQFSQCLLSELEKRHEVAPFTFNSQYPNWLFPGKSQYVHNKQAIEHKRVVSTFNPLSYISSLKVFKKEKPTVFVVNYWMTFMSPMMVFWAKRMSKNTLKVAIIHNFIPHESRFFDRIFNKWMLNNYDIFITLSSKVESDIKTLKPLANVLHIPHPTYEHFAASIDKKLARRTLELDEELKTLLFFGIIRDYKGLDILMKAFSYLPLSYQLIIAGEVYGSVEEYTLLIQQSKNDKIYFFNEFIPDEKVHLFFSAADLCVLPYRSGTQSGVKAIADKMNTPTLISNVGGIAEKISDGEDGFIINELSAIALKNKIIDIFKGSDLTLVERNLTELENNRQYTWDSFAEKLTNKIQQ